MDAQRDAKLSDLTGRQLGELLAETSRIIKSHISKRLEPLQGRLDLLESRRCMRFAGQWKHELQYASDDVVILDGFIWRANATTRSRPGKDATWQKLAKSIRPGVKVMNVPSPPPKWRRKRR